MNEMSCKSLTYCGQEGGEGDEVEFLSESQLLFHHCFSSSTYLLTCKMHFLYIRLI